MKLHDALNVAALHPEDVLGVRRSFMPYGKYIKISLFDNAFLLQNDEPNVMTCGDIIATDWEVIYKGLVFSQYKVLMNIIKEHTENQMDNELRGQKLIGSIEEEEQLHLN